MSKYKLPARERRRRKQRTIQILSGVGAGMLLLVLLALAMAMYTQQEAEFTRLANRREKLEEEKTQALQAYKEASALRQLVGTPEYVERVARDQLGMVRPNEIIFQDD